MKQKFASVTFCAFFPIALCFAFCSCAYSPAKTGIWYLESIWENGVSYSAGTEENYHGTLLSSDYLVFDFEKDGTVKITDLSGGVRKGTYTEKRGGKDSEITVTLEDGGSLTGRCGKYMFDGIWYEFYLTDGNATYYLTENNHLPKESAVGMFLKEAYPELAALDPSDITEIVLNSDEWRVCITETDEIERFTGAFATANFLRNTHYGYPDYGSRHYVYSFTVTADKSYVVPMRVRGDFEETDVFFGERYYKLRGDLSGFLLRAINNTVEVK